MIELQQSIGKRTLIMGILNVTPDSFSDGGLYYAADKAVEHALEMAEEGADIIDVGGESSRPGSEGVSLEEELRRVIPVIEALSKKTTIPISIDTTKAETARQAVQAGAVLINDISALTHDPAMLKTAVELKSAVCLMHMQGTPRTMQDNPNYEDVVGDIMSYLAERAETCSTAGIPSHSIWIDPGIGFGKTFEHNLILIRRLAEFKQLGYPLLVGLSRKAFIGAAGGGLPADERLEGTLAALAIAVLNGADIVRVHDVKAAKRACDMASAIKRISL